MRPESNFLNAAWAVDSNSYWLPARPPSCSYAGEQAGSRAGSLSAHSCLCLLVVVGSCLRQGVGARHGVVRLQQNWNWQQVTPLAAAPAPPPRPHNSCRRCRLACAGSRRCCCLALTVRVMAAPAVLESWV